MRRSDSSDGSGVRGRRRRGSDGTGTTVGTERSPRAVACTGREGFRRWVSGAEHTRSVGLVSFEHRKKIPENHNGLALKLN